MWREGVKWGELKKSPCFFLLCTYTLESREVQILLLTHGSSVAESQWVRTVADAFWLQTSVPNQCIFMQFSVRRLSGKVYDGHPRGGL